MSAADELVEKQGPKKFSDIMAKKKGTVVRESIQLDGEIALNIETLRRSHADAVRADARFNRTPEAPKIAKEIEALTEAAKKSEAEFVFKSIGRARWDSLVTAHPATEEMREKIEQETGEVPQWNVDTFPPALIAMSCIDPVMTSDEVEQMWNSDEWSGGELLKLFFAALRANQEAPNIPFDRIATELTPSIEPKLTIAPSAESQEASS